MGKKRKQTQAQIRNKRIRFEARMLLKHIRVVQPGNFVMISATTPFIASYDTLQRLLAKRRKK